MYLLKRERKENSVPQSYVGSVGIPVMSWTKYKSQQETFTQQFIIKKCFSTTPSFPLLHPTQGLSFTV